MSDCALMPLYEEKKQLLREGNVVPKSKGWTEWCLLLHLCFTTNYTQSISPHTRDLRCVSITGFKSQVMLSGGGDASPGQKCENLGGVG